MYRPKFHNHFIFTPQFAIDATPNFKVFNFKKRKFCANYFQLCGFSVKPLKNVPTARPANKRNATARLNNRPSEVLEWKN